MKGMHPYTVNIERLRLYVFIGLLAALITPLVNTLMAHLSFLSSLSPWVSVGPSFGLVYALLFAFYNQTAWKWKILHVFGIPNITDLNGTYTGELISSYNRETRVPLKLDVVQTWTKLLVYIRAGSDTSQSYSFMASLFEIDDKSLQNSHIPIQTSRSAQ